MKALVVSALLATALGAKVASSAEKPSVAPRNGTIPPWLAQEIAMGGDIKGVDDLPLDLNTNTIEHVFQVDIEKRWTFHEMNSSRPPHSEIELVWVHCHEDWITSPFLQGAPMMFKKVTIIEKCNDPSTMFGPNVHHTQMFNRGYEGAGYIRFIIDRYSDLPPWTVFVHGNPEEHNGGLRDIFRRLDQWRLLNLNSHGWLDLNGAKIRGRHLSDIDLGRGMASMIQKTPELEDPHHVIDFYCCMQHMVRAAHIRSRPKEFWLRFYGIIEENHLGLSKTGKTFEHEMGVMYEHSFHVVYGEHWSGMKFDHWNVLQTLLA